MFIALSLSTLAQNWFPLEIGNKWQFLITKITYTPPNIIFGYSTFSLKEIAVIKDTLINEVRYFFCDSDWFRYSNNDKIIYIWHNNQEKVYMDFNIPVGAYFLHIDDPNYMISGGSVVIFSDTNLYRGFKKSTYSPPGISGSNETRFTDDVGWYFFFSGYRDNYGIGESNYTEVLMSIQYDSLGNTAYLTNYYRPQLNIIPITNIHSQLFILDFTVDHNFNEQPSE
jgi:hypothetical protein